MEKYFSLVLLSLLLACGEARIKSVDDEVMNDAEKDKAAAAIKSEEAAILGTWQVDCVKIGDNEAARYEYAFSQGGQVKIRKQSFNKPTCEEPSQTAKDFAANYEFVPVEGKGTFTLKFKWADGEKLESEYKLNGSEGKFPKVIELKSKRELKLLELTSTENFVELRRTPADQVEKSRHQVEQQILDYASGLLQRKGLWKTACKDSKQTILKFEGSTDFTVNLTVQGYKDAECKTADDTKAEKSSVAFSLDSVPDLSQTIIALKVKEGKGSLKVDFHSVDQIRISLPSKDEQSYTFAVEESKP